MMQEEHVSISTTNRISSVQDAATAALRDALEEIKRLRAGTELRAAFKEIERLRALVPDWLPIETAPKNGTFILASIENSSSVGIVRWSETKGWCAQGMSELYFTHWMPLPYPPKQKEMTDQ